jgi:hypothetical protein
MEKSDGAKREFMKIGTENLRKWKGEPWLSKGNDRTEMMPAKKKTYETKGLAKSTGVNSGLGLPPPKELTIQDHTTFLEIRKDSGRGGERAARDLYIVPLTT